jgi:hypothetical protein
MAPGSRVNREDDVSPAASSAATRHTGAEVNARLEWRDVQLCLGERAGHVDGGLLADPTAGAAQPAYVEAVELHRFTGDVGLDLAGVTRGAAYGSGRPAHPATKLSRRRRVLSPWRRNTLTTPLGEIWSPPDIGVPGGRQCVADTAKGTAGWACVVGGVLKAGASRALAFDLAPQPV